MRMMRKNSLIGILAPGRRACQTEQDRDAKTIEIIKPLTALWNALLARQGIVAYLPIIIVNILMLCVASWQFFWLNTDPARYQCYALTFWLGSSGAQLLPAIQCSFLHISSVAYRTFQMLPLEYPPLTLAIFSLALFALLLYYHLILAVLMA